MNIKVIKTGSKGNAVVYGQFLVDCALTKKEVKEECENITDCYVTHRHGDHWGATAIKQLVNQGVNIYIHEVNKRFFNKKLGKEFTDEHITYVKNNFNFLTKGDRYAIVLEEVPHDVKNYALKIEISNPFKKYRIFHVTDAGSIAHLDAKDYNVYAIETNYSDERIRELIYFAKKGGKYDRYSRSMKTHLSKKQAFTFLNKNKGNNFERFIRLHMSNKTLD